MEWEVEAYIRIKKRKIKSNMYFHIDFDHETVASNIFRLIIIIIILPRTCGMQLLQNVLPGRD